MQEAVLPPWVCWKHLYASVVGIEPRQSYSSVGQSATLIMWRSAVQVCLGLLLFQEHFGGCGYSRGGLAQLARAPALQAGGHRFESDILHHPLL